MTVLALALCLLNETKLYMVDGIERRAMVVPSQVKATSGNPVIFAFHGHGGNIRNAARTFDFKTIWPEATLVYMEGIPIAGRTDPEGKFNGWQKLKGEVGDRDLHFFDAVYADITKRFSIDKSRVYAMGHSNGGRFTYVLWAARAAKFAAFGPSASPGRFMNLSPKPAFIVAGRNDQLVSFASQEATLSEVKRINMVKSETKEKDTHVTTYTGGTPLQSYIHDGTHAFPRECLKPMAEFFRSQVLRD